MDEELDMQRCAETEAEAGSPALPSQGGEWDPVPVRTAILDGAVIRDRRALHAALADQLDFPDWYGGNLDALYDLLSVERTPCRILFRNREALDEALGGYFRSLLGLLRDLRDEGCPVETEDAD